LKTQAQQTALVTGASSGIGHAYAERLAARGHDLVLVARRADRLKDLAEALGSRHGTRVTLLPADLSAPEDIAVVEKAINDHETLTMVVNSAGVGALKEVKDAHAHELDQLVAVNILALTRLSRAAVLAFRTRGGGRLVNIASLGAFKSPPGGAAYGASKAYVLSFSRSLHRENRESGVFVQVVLPGPVRTEFFESAGVDTSMFPDESFVSAHQLVDAALLGLDKGEDVCIPTLPDLGAWERASALQRDLRDAAGLRGVIATRYADPRS
jgi:short-subunit dehydrogenase